MQYAVVCGVLQAEVLSSGERHRPSKSQTSSQQGGTTGRGHRRSRYREVHPSHAHVARVGSFPRFPPLPLLKGRANSAILAIMNSYQVRFSVLQAGVYGAPQYRRRVIFWGARRGIPLPEFPIPTHNFDSRQWAVQLDTGLRLDHVARDPSMSHRGAPLRSITVDDVISDLVSFNHSICRCQAYRLISPSRPLLLLRLAAQV